MAVITTLNYLDYLIIFILFIGMLIGLIRGAVPQLISFFSIFGGLLATLWLYQTFSFRILQGLGISERAADTMSFVILLIVFFHAVRLIIKSVSTPPEDKKKKPIKKRGRVGPVVERAKTSTEKYILGPLNALGGMVMGVILTGLWMALILVIFQFLLQDAVFEATGGQGRGLAVQLRTSSLRPFFNQVVYYIAFLLDFVDPPNQKNLLQTVLERVIGAPQ